MRVLVTGGAGFIGSNLVGSLLDNAQVSFVRVLDNFSTGHKNNISEFLSNPKFELLIGDIRNSEDCLKACGDIDVISHQAALGSVPRSIKDPLTSHQVNVNGFINLLEAARENNIKKFVYASSSSVYGDLSDSPKIESRIGKVLSPYAATKRVNEVYADAYSKIYGITLVGLRYFNVFGPKQNPNGPYAAVIPIFVQAAIDGKSPMINGDGSITRDYTPVENVVNVNIAAIKTQNLPISNEVFNIACGNTTSLQKLWELICEDCGNYIQPTYGPIRSGDILSSLADINKAKELLSYTPETDLKKELNKTIQWYRDNDSGKYFS
ncbi:MAG: LPS biosynthesis protein WbpP [Bacteroidetes bacterium B1(2017)]|nr:MAG: LPS biosynthesis protein WbpP [Bacteroidetes bacterium B1(2017)]